MKGGMSIRRDASSGGWESVMPDGTLHQTWYIDERLPWILSDPLERRRAEQQTALANVNGFDNPDARTIRPQWVGERFELHECVQALFRMRLPDAEQEAA